MPTTDALQTLPTPLVLASSSPFRRKLLSRLGLPFATIAPNIDESPKIGETPQKMAHRLAETKARAVVRQYPAALIIGSDQVATLDGKVYGKPGSHSAAVAQLRDMQGQTVEFFTALCLFNSQRGSLHQCGVATFVTFRTLHDQDIENYLRREPAYDCAGSAKAEGLGISLITRIVGDDPNALIGLPLIALCDFLRAEGIAIP